MHFPESRSTIFVRISLKFVTKGPINNTTALVHIMNWHRPGNKPLSEPMMVNLLMHICVTRPQWVNFDTDAINCSISYMDMMTYPWPKFNAGFDVVTKMPLWVFCNRFSCAVSEVKCLLMLLWLKEPGHQQPSVIARLMGPAWGPSGADRTQVGPMLAPWTLLSGIYGIDQISCNISSYFIQINGTINPPWPNGAIWRHTSKSTLAHVMAWHWTDADFPLMRLCDIHLRGISQRSAQAIILCNEFKFIVLKLLLFHWGQWVDLCWYHVMYWMLILLFLHIHININYKTQEMLCF